MNYQNFMFKVPSDVDAMTGKSWKELNSLITKSYDEASEICGNSVINETIQMISSKMHYKYSHPYFRVYGSSVEGAMFSGLRHEQNHLTLDIDLMYDFLFVTNIRQQPINAHEQMISFRYLPDYPGYLNILVSNLDWKDIAIFYEVEKNNQVYLSSLKARKIWSNTEILFNTRESQKYFMDSDPNEGKASISFKLGRYVNPNAKDYVQSILDSVGDDNWAKSIVDHYFYLRNKDHVFRAKSGKFETWLDEYKEDETWEKISNYSLTIEGHIDFVLAINCESWPAIAEEWKTRTRMWPPKCLVDKIVNDGFHVIPKASPGGDAELEWRLSFSKAELTLAGNRTHVKKKCYYIFKTMFKENLTESEIISSYYLKTIMMWATEQNPPEYWREDNIGQAVIGLLDDLYQAVITGYLPHYFIPQNNLLRHIPIQLLNQEADNILYLRKNVMKTNRGEPPISDDQHEVHLSIKEFKLLKAKYIEASIKNYHDLFDMVRKFYFLNKHSKNSKRNFKSEFAKCFKEVDLNQTMDTELQLQEDYLVKLFPDKKKPVQFNILQEKKLIYLFYDFLIYLLDDFNLIDTVIDIFARYMVNSLDSDELADAFIEIQTILPMPDQDDKTIKLYKNVIPEQMDTEQLRDLWLEMLNYLLKNETLTERLKTLTSDHFTFNLPEYTEDKLGPNLFKQGTCAALKEKLGDTWITDLIYNRLKKEGLVFYKYRLLYVLHRSCKNDKQLFREIFLMNSSSSDFLEYMTLLNKIREYLKLPVPVKNGVKEVEQLKEAIKTEIEGLPTDLKYHLINEFLEVMKNLKHELLLDDINEEQTDLNDVMKMMTNRDIFKGELMFYREGK